MAADDKTPTGRDLDKALELEEARLSERVRMRLDSHEDEDSTVIERRALEATKSDSSIPPRGRFLLRLVGLVPAGQRWIVILAALLFVGFVAWLVGPGLLSKVGL